MLRLFAYPMLDFLLRQLLAALFGGVLGWERETKNKPAGLRTMMMVALGSAGVTSVMLWLYERLLSEGGAERLDPLRIVEGVIGGIGFLGAGSIIRSGGSVHGITTAATIWVVGAIGIACGVGQLAMAFALTAYAWLILRGMAWLERRFHFGRGKLEDKSDEEAEPPT